LEERIAALLVIFFIGFVFGKLHNAWIMKRESRVERLKLHKQVATERKLLRPRERPDRYLTATGQSAPNCTSKIGATPLNH
jgi:hypothetical protein